MGHSTSKHPSRQLEHNKQILQPIFKIPTLIGNSQLLNEEKIETLSQYLPSEEYRNKWKLLYNSTKHGLSFNRFCYHVQGEGPNLVIIRSKNGQVFGGFAESWKGFSPKFYGSSHAFVFSLEPSIKCYRITGYNDHYQYLNAGTTELFNGVGQGGQLNFFTWSIDESFEKGHCQGNPSSTFGNPPFTPDPNYEVDLIEVWEVKEAEFSYELEKVRKQKNKKKSVLNDEDNAEKVITGLLGHNFSSFEANAEKEKEEE